MIGMVAWMGAKMAAHWGKESQENRISNIVTVRFLVLVGTMVSLLFAMIGGLICAGKLWFKPAYQHFNLLQKIGDSPMYNAIRRFDI